VEQREFIVQLVVITSLEYVVTARSEEDAISQAEGMYEDGDTGKTLSSDFESADAFPYRDEEIEEEEYE
jgi:hypothetical protein